MWVEACSLVIGLCPPTLCRELFFVVVWLTLNLDFGREVKQWHRFVWKLIALGTKVEQKMTD